MRTKEVKVANTVKNTTKSRRSSLIEKNESMWGYIFTAPSLVILLALLYIPMGYSIYLSLFDTTMANSVYKFVGLKGFVDTFKNGYIGEIIGNSFIWTFAVVAGQLLVGLIGAMLLKDPFPGRWFIRSLVILPWAIPGVVAAMMWRLVYDAQIGIFNMFLMNIGIMDVAKDWLGDPKLALWAVILTAIWKGFPFSMLMCLAALQNVPQEQYDAANIDGASRWQQFVYVTIPSISEVLRTTALLTSIWTFNYFEIIWVMTRGGPLRSTHIFPTYIYELSFRNFNFGEASRFAVISFIIVSAFSFLYIRQLRKTEQI